MRSIFLCSLVVLSAFGFGNFALGQHVANPEPAANSTKLATAPDASSVSPNPTGAALSAASMRIAPGSKLFIEPMDGFDTYLSAAILKKKVPVLVVGDRSEVDFIVTGGSHVDKAGWAKTIFISPLPHAEASIAIKDAHTGNLVFAYNVDKSNAVRANQSTAEACAKHLKEAIEKK